jgi:glyoxylase-like metal-dependent hydrolase (beta-lactamase superfamily II)
MLTLERFRVGSDNLSYLFHNGSEGLMVDPGHDPSGVLEFVRSRGIDLRFAVLTHHHDDHVHSVEEVVEETGARVVSGLYCSKRVKADLVVKEGDELLIGGDSIKVIETPGHTPGGICLIVDERYLITGDTIFIDDCGRCDLPGGSIEKMFETLQRLKKLDDGLVVLPGHDYGPLLEDTLGNQKKRSKVLLAEDLRDFSRI